MSRERRFPPPKKIPNRIQKWSDIWLLCYFFFTFLRQNKNISDKKELWCNILVTFLVIYTNVTVMVVTLAEVWFGMQWVCLYSKRLGLMWVYRSGSFSFSCVKVLKEKRIFYPPIMAQLHVKEWCTTQKVRERPTQREKRRNERRGEGENKRERKEKSTEGKDTEGKGHENGVC